MEIILSAFVIGLLGSLHCIGMCGPIALALPVPQTSKLMFVTGRILYNLGRVVTYSFMGLVLGLLGKGIMLTGFQQGLSITLGGIILISFLLPKKLKAKVTNSSVINRLTIPLKNSIGKLFKQKTLPSFLLIGILNGFLPCGFVYIGIAGAIATGNAISGALFMMLFGLGTVPAMFAATLFGKLISFNVRMKIRKAVPVFALVMALILILRGMNLGIPYISPLMNKAHAVQHEPECCH